MSRRHDHDPAPRGWVVVDPQTWWDLGECDDDEGDRGNPFDLADDTDDEPTHTPIPTYDIIKSTTYQLGRHTIHTTTRVITTRKPEEAS